MTGTQKAEMMKLIEEEKNIIADHRKIEAELRNRIEAYWDIEEG